MKVLLINSVCGIGSTGKICAALADEFAREGHEVRIAYGRDGTVPEKYKKYAYRIGNDVGVRVHAVRTRLMDDHGFASGYATRKFLKWAEEYQPDLLWLHNLHGYYLHVGMLFDWIKKHPDMQVKWTLHDCWAFTGHCVHFVYARCEKWKTGCSDCPESRMYPASILRDNSRENYERKKNAFTGVKNMELIVPSRWLGALVKESFLGEYPVQVCYNTVDTRVFCPTPGNFREKYGLTGKTVILGVAGIWTERKGFDDFIKLAQILDERYAVVLVGLNDRQLRTLPRGIIGLGRTRNARELAELYSSADVLFNPTYEDTYPTVNLEAEACGTRVVTYDTGGCAETIHRADSKVIPVGEYRLLPVLLKEENGVEPSGDTD